jgi:2-polyprenyl-3-methyl-5-hydroxy-6-metoxy-1,4-benzoquinol methylase
VIALGFAAGRTARGLAGALGRSRWRRVLPGAHPVEAGEAVPDWPAAGLLVREETALPAASASRTLEAFFGDSDPAVGLPRDNRACSSERRWEPPRVHTLREFEEATSAPPGGAGECAFDGDGRDAPALAYRNLPAAAISGKTPEELFAACLSGALAPRRLLPEFEIFRFSETFGDRPELRAKIPRSARSLLDVGCGAGEAGAAARRDHPGLSVTGIEIDLPLAARAREILDLVLVGDAETILSHLAGEEARFDVVLMGDVLEHALDPRAVLRGAARVLGPKGRLLASVPNVAHASIVRDLLLGRFDYLPAGLCDAGHLRFFTPGSLRRMFEEEGWTILEEERLAGVPAPGAERFLAELAAAGIACDARILNTYQTVLAAER